MTGPESVFQDQVIELAHIYRWRVAHFRPAQTNQGWRTPVSADGKGFPDLVIVRAPELIIAELKSQQGVLSADQKIWIADMQQVAAVASSNVEVYVWRPSDFDEIQTRLSQPRLQVAA